MLHKISILHSRVKWCYFVKCLLGFVGPAGAFTQDVAVPNKMPILSRSYGWQTQGPPMMFDYVSVAQLVVFKKATFSVYSKL